MSIRPRITSTLPAGTILLLFLSLCPAARACDGTSSLTCNGQPQTYAGPSGSCSASSLFGGGKASFDVTQGRVYAAAQGGFGTGSADAATDDEYLVKGPGSGPVTLTAVLTSQPIINAGSGTLLIRQSTSNQNSRSLNEMDRFQTIYLPLTIQTAIGQAFALHYEVSASAYSTSQVDGVMSFTNLPAGVSVVSCRYLVTPVHATTWGQVRKIYH